MAGSPRQLNTGQTARVRVDSTRLHGSPAGRRRRGAGEDRERRPDAEPIIGSCHCTCGCGDSRRATPGKAGPLSEGLHIFGRLAEAEKLKEPPRARRVPSTIPPGESGAWRSNDSGILRALSLSVFHKCGSTTCLHLSGKKLDVRVMADNRPCFGGVKRPGRRLREAISLPNPIQPQRVADDWRLVLRTYVVQPSCIHDQGIAAPLLSQRIAETVEVHAPLAEFECATLVGVFERGTNGPSLRDRAPRRPSWPSPCSSAARATRSASGSVASRARRRAASATATECRQRVRQCVGRLAR